MRERESEPECQLDSFSLFFSRFRANLAVFREASCLHVTGKKAIFPCAPAGFGDLRQALAGLARDLFPARKCRQHRTLKRPSMILAVDEHFESMSTLFCYLQNGEI